MTTALPVILESLQLHLPYIAYHLSLTYVTSQYYRILLLLLF